MILSTAITTQTLTDTELTTLIGNHYYIQDYPEGTTFSEMSWLQRQHKGSIIDGLPWLRKILAIPPKEFRAAFQPAEASPSPTDATPHHQSHHDAAGSGSGGGPAAAAPQPPEPKPAPTPMPGAIPGAPTADPPIAGGQPQIADPGAAAESSAVREWD